MTDRQGASPHPAGYDARREEVEPLVAGLRKEAYRKATEMSSSIAEQGTASGSSMKENLEQARLDVEEVRHSHTASEVRHNLVRLLRTLDSGPVARALARALVCAYYINLVYTSYQMWANLNTSDKAKAFRRRITDPFTVQGFPYWGVCGILPCCALTIADVLVPFTSSVLLGHELFHKGKFAALQLYSIARYHVRPTEVLMQHIAIVGSTTLVLIYAIKNTQVVRSIAGPLRSDDTEEGKPGRLKSFAILVARLMLAGLLMFVGYTQLVRLKSRDMQWKAEGQHHYGVRDSHDNGWLLAECALALPLIVGLKTEAVSLLLGIVLVVEALSCWQFWMAAYPTWWLRAGIRDHFFVNLAGAGGLLLLQSFGAGSFTVDELMKSKAD